MDKSLDEKIILALNQEGRLSNARLARKLGVSVSTVAKRVNYLLDEGAIVVRAIVNPNKMGYRISAVVALDVDLTEVSRICDELVDNVNISLIVTTFGRFDILLVMDYSDWDALHEFLENKLYRIKGIRAVEIFFSEMPKRYRGIFSDDVTVPQPPLDEADMVIIGELHKNGRVGYGGLARELGLSSATISRRVASLCERDIIRIMAVPTPSFFGFTATAYLGIQADFCRIESICEQLSSSKRVHLVVRLLNGFDLIVGVHCNSTESLYHFIRDEVSSIPGINQIETLIRAELRKRLVSILR